MEALQFTLETKKLELVQKPVPKIQNPRDVLVKVAFAGICGTDLHIIQGEFPCREDSPITLGHEISGTVEAVGHGVTTIKIGDKVSIDPNSGCHCCKLCHVGNSHFCKTGGLNNTIGIFRNGGWAEYLLLPDEQVHKLPTNVSLEQGVLCEPFSCLAHGLNKLGPIPIGQEILILGAGIIGNLWISTLHLKGHKKVTISEPNADRRQFVSKLNTEFECIAPDELKRRHSLNPDYLFDTIIDCSGFAPAIEQAFYLLNDGGKLCIFGVSAPHAKINIPPYEIFKREATILGVKINPNCFQRAIGLVESMGSRYLDYEKLGIKVFKLKEYSKAIETLKKGIIAKAVFKI